MTTPVVAVAVPAAAPPAQNPPSADGADRFASALDDAVAGEHGRTRGQGRTDGVDATSDGSPEAGAQTPTEDTVPAGPAVPPAGMPPGLWALFTGIGPGWAGAASAATSATPGSAVVQVARAVGDLPGAVGLPGSVPPAAALPDAAPPGAPLMDAVPVGTPAPAPTAGPVPGPTAAVPAAGLPGAAPAVPPSGVTSADHLPGLAVVVAPAAERVAPANSPEPDPLALSLPAPLPTTPAQHAAGSPSADAGTTPEQDSPAPAAPAPAAAPPAAPQTTILPPVGSPADATPTAPVGTQVAQHVAVLRHAPDGAHTMTVVLTPETLGTVEIRVTLTQGSVDLTLRGATEAGRTALLDALPDLRRDLQSAGLTCTNATVDRDPGTAWTSAQQHAGGDRAGQQGRPDSRGAPWQRVPDLDEGRSVPVPTTAASGLDVRV